MCITSTVLDYGMRQIPQDTWTRPVFDEYQDIIRRLERLDEKLQQPDCEDPAKAEWMKAVEKRLVELERA